MQRVVSPYIPFPNLFWWANVMNSDEVIFDTAEHFEKMSYRNRYYITGANGGIMLSIPLVKGRNQRTPMSEVQIDNTEDWQKNHLRTITSVYGRAPYFEYYIPELTHLFEGEYTHLSEFNKATIAWLQKHIGAKFDETTAATYQPEYGDAIDLRKNFKPGIEQQAIDNGVYYQLFQERNGFLPNLSVLDLLLSEGPAAFDVIRQNTATIKKWGNT